MNPPEPVPAVRPVAAAPLHPPRVGWRFVSLYALSYAGGSLLFLGPLLVSLALKVNHLVGMDDAPGNLGDDHGRPARPARGRLHRRPR